MQAISDVEFHQVFDSSPAINWVVSNDGSGLPVPDRETQHALLQQLQQAILYGGGHPPKFEKFCLIRESSSEGTSNIVACDDISPIYGFFDDPEAESELDDEVS